MLLNECPGPREELRIGGVGRKEKALFLDGSSALIEQFFLTLFWSFFQMSLDYRYLKITPLNIPSILLKHSA